MDVITGIWAMWIFFLFYILLSHPNMIMKALVVALIALSAHDAWKYINDLKEMREEEAQALENKEKENAKKDHE